MRPISNEKKKMNYNAKQVQIIEEAEKLFAAEGFTAASVRDIAKNSNVNVAMISYYFGSKENLLTSIFSYRSEGFSLKLENLLNDDSMSAYEKMCKMMEAYVEKISRQPCFHSIMVREQMKAHPFMSDLISDMKKRNQGMVKQIVNQGQERGEFNDDVDISFIMCTLLGTINHAFTTKHFYKEINNLGHLTEDELNDLLVSKLKNHLKIIIKSILVKEN